MGDTEFKVPATSALMMTAHLMTNYPLVLVTPTDKHVKQKGRKSQEYICRKAISVLYRL